LQWLVLDYLWQTRHNGFMVQTTLKLDVTITKKANNRFLVDVYNFSKYLFLSKDTVKVQFLSLQKFPLNSNVQFKFHECPLAIPKGLRVLSQTRHQAPE